MKLSYTALKGALITGLVLSLLGCSPKIVEHTNIVERIDTITRVVKVPVEIQVPVEVRMAIETDYSFLETSVAESEACIDSSGRLHHTLRNKDVKLHKDTIVMVQYVNRDVEREVVKEVEVERKLTWWQRTKMYAGLLLMALAAVWIGYKVIKR